MGREDFGSLKLIRDFRLSFQSGLWRIATRKRGRDVHSYPQWLPSSLNPPPSPPLQTHIRLSNAVPKNVIYKSHHLRIVIPNFMCLSTLLYTSRCLILLPQSSGLGLGSASSFRYIVLSVFSLILSLPFHSGCFHPLRLCLSRCLGDIVLTSLFSTP